MGLALEVGILADLNENDEEGAAHLREEFETLNRYLRTISMKPHEEPASCEVWSSEMYGYAGLHYLRRVAAHLDLTGKLPAPGDREAANDPLLKQYYEVSASQPPAPGFLGRLFGRKTPPRPAATKRSFNHLIIHSDAEGYYLPQSFPEVLIPDERFPIAGGIIGSSEQLLDECVRLAEALKLPLDLDPESEEVWEAPESQGEGTEQWQRYGVESFTCLRLYTAAQHSIRTKAAIVFS